MSSPFNLHLRPAIIWKSIDGWAQRSCYATPEERLADAARMLASPGNYHKHIEFANAWHAHYKPGKDLLDIDVGYASFEKRADLIISGNAVTQVQSSMLIRARNQTHCNNHEFKHGDLQESDISCWPSQCGAVARFIRRNPYFDENPCAAYVFRHVSNKGETVRHGAFLLTKDGDIFQEFGRCALGEQKLSVKSENVMALARRLLTNRGVEDRYMAFERHDNVDIFHDMALEKAVKNARCQLVA